ncbi:MAG: LPS export ABC transporter periplasmic protein LptC [Alcaligenaceae bacterium]|nr:LPS export ABC transporter periplasmic protein LptC [Alcaligenaceae bacterium]
MRERVPGLVAIALLASLVAGTWWAADYAQRAIPLDPPRRVTHEPDAWASNFVMVRTDPAGIAINRLEGDYLRHYPDDDSYEIDQIRAIGQQPGAPLTIGTARTAIMDQDGDRITMNGNAHLHRQAGPDTNPLDVTSEQLVVLPDEDIVYTDLPARVVNNKSVMNGTGMRYDNKTRQLQVFSSTDVKISGEDARPQKQTPQPDPG